MLLGHTQGTTTGRYRILPEGDLKHRMGMIDAIADQGSPWLAFTKSAGV
jgi:hypothetical protein